MKGLATLGFVVVFIAGVVFFVLSLLELKSSCWRWIILLISKTKDLDIELVVFNWRVEIGDV